MISSAKTIKFSGQPLPHFYTVIFFSPCSNRVLRVFTSALQVSKCTQFVHKDIASLLVWLFHETALIQAHVLKWQPYFPSPSKYVSTKIVQKTQASTIGPSLIGPLGNSLRKTSQGKFTCAVILGTFIRLRDMISISNFSCFGYFAHWYLSVSDFNRVKKLFFHIPRRSMNKPTGLSPIQG